MGSLGMGKTVKPWVRPQKSDLTREVLGNKPQGDFTGILVEPTGKAHEEKECNYSL